MSDFDTIPADKQTDGRSNLVTYYGYYSANMLQCNTFTKMYP